MRTTSRRVPAIAVLLGSFLFLSACQSIRPQPRPVTLPSAAIQHLVLIKLDDPARVPEVIADTEATLAHIPGIATLSSATPLPPTSPNALDDYDVCSQIAVDHEAAYTAYTEHPDHKALVARWRAHFVSFRIVDFLAGADQ
ncbi:MAG: Dabb family protein [Phycisphaerales bacterium]|nr:Dabb family protein [Phycisphaerales bacterium]